MAAARNSVSGTEQVGKRSACKILRGQPEARRFLAQPVGLRFWQFERQFHVAYCSPSHAL